MADIDSNHMNYLEQVTKADVDMIRRKEKTYKGSWKKRGGIGAAMMILRKADRLEILLQDRNYDIFKDPGDGSDGSPLAEIRDLRAYLILVEAEIMARGLDRTPIERKPNTYEKDRAVDVVSGKIYNSVSELPPCNYDTVVIDTITGAKTHVPGTPEDGGHHARQPEPDLLQDNVFFKDVDPVDRANYLLVKTGGQEFGLVNRDKLPVDELNHLPYLPVQISVQEHAELPPAYQWVYNWIEKDQQFQMIPGFRKHWAKP